jgi:RimJ/RimL family protein N-acetyltransferase
LRPPEERDYPLILEWQNDPEVSWLMDYERRFTLEDIVQSERLAKEEGHPYVIEVGGRPIGRIGVNQFRERDRICSLYVFIGERAAWGKGHGTDAMMALLVDGFERYDLARVELWSLADNERAIRAYRHCGFEIDARLPERSFKDGRFYDRIVMSVPRQRFLEAFAEWKGSRTAPS